MHYKLEHYWPLSRLRERGSMHYKLTHCWPLSRVRERGWGEGRL